MNDFTKDELERIRWIILQIREDYPASHADPDTKQLLIKVQSMITNYCEDKILLVAAQDKGIFYRFSICNKEFKGD